MIRVVEQYQPPAIPPATGNFRADAEALRKYIAERLEPYNFNFFNDLVNSFNNGSQGEGLPLTISASTLKPTSFIHHVTNNATVTTITVPANFPFAGQLTLIADAGLTFQTGGNIANTKTLTVGSIATLTYSIQSGKWYIISLVSSLGDVTDFAAWQANTAYLLQDSIIDPNGNLQAATTAGTSGGTIPTFNLTVGGTTSDGATLVWTNRGAPPVPPTRFTVRAVDVNHRSIIDVSQAHPNKTIDNVPDGVSRFASPANLTAATNGQLPIGMTGTGVVLGTLTAGSGVTVTNGSGTVKVDNSGVVSATAGTGISITAGSNPTISNTGVTSATGGQGITVSGSTGAVTWGTAPGGDVSGTLDALVINRSATVAAGGFDFHYAEVANGGGAAPTFGTIGGSGPATAAQDGWIKVRVNGVNAWVPVWK